MKRTFCKCFQCFSAMKILQILEDGGIHVHGFFAKRGGGAKKMKKWKNVKKRKKSNFFEIFWGGPSSPLMHMYDRGTFGWKVKSLARSSWTGWQMVSLLAPKWISGIPSQISFNFSFFDIAYNLQHEVVI